MTKAAAASGPVLTGDPEQDILIYEAWERGETYTARSDALERGPVAVEQALAEDLEPVSATVVKEEPVKVEEKLVEAPPVVAEVVDQLALDAEAAEVTVAAGPVVIDGVNMGASATVGTHKEKHSRLILTGTCSQCAHCAMKLTDAVSIERGLGPVCSKRGYEDVEPKDPDEMQAFIALAEYPTLCEHLATEWKPKGIRGLMNGLVRICSLNRKSPVHRACTEAIELLGYPQLAATLRESLAVVSIKASEEFPGEVEVWVKRSEFTGDYGREIREIFGSHWVAHKSSTTGRRGKRLVPITREKDGETLKVMTFTRWPDGSKRVHWAPDTIDGKEVKQMSNKALVWHLLCRHFEGLICKTDQGGVLIKPVQPKKA